MQIVIFYFYKIGKISFISRGNGFPIKFPWDINLVKEEFNQTRFFCL